MSLSAGRKTLHGHWLLWIQNFNVLRQSLFDKDGEVQEDVKKSLEAYIELAMSSSYGKEEDLKMIHDCNEMMNATSYSDVNDADDIPDWLENVHSEAAASTKSNVEAGAKSSRHVTEGQDADQLFFDPANPQHKEQA